MASRHPRRYTAATPSGTCTGRWLQLQKIEEILGQIYVKTVFLPTVPFPHYTLKDRRTIRPKNKKEMFDSLPFQFPA